MPSIHLWWSPLGILSVGSLFRTPSVVVAQQANIDCLPQFNWMNNTKDQNPCFVAAYVQSVCHDGDWTVPPLLPGSTYTGPSVDQNNSCTCCSVTYNLMAACSACQNASYSSWSSWTANCSTNYLGYPDDIPVGTAIPNWAYQNLQQSDKFNVALAQSVGDAPESTATKAQETATGAAASTSLVTLPSGTSSPASSNSSNAGAIAGGVVGGVVVLGAIAALATWFFTRRRRRRRTPPAVQLMNQWGQLNGVDPARLRLHDPSDPSTFPTHTPPHSGTSSPAIAGKNVKGYNRVPEL